MSRTTTLTIPAPRAVLQVIHPFCLSTLETVDRLAITSEGMLRVEGLCLTCEKYVEIVIDVRPPQMPALPTTATVQRQPLTPELVRQAIIKTHGNVKRAAKLLHYDRKTLYHYMDKEEWKKHRPHYRGRPPRKAATVKEHVTAIVTGVLLLLAGVVPATAQTVTATFNAPANVTTLSDANSLIATLYVNNGTGQVLTALTCTGATVPFACTASALPSTPVTLNTKYEVTLKTATSEESPRSIPFIKPPDAATGLRVK